MTALPQQAAAFATAFAANFNRRDLDAIANFYAEDAVMDLGGLRFAGRDAIRAPLANFLAAGLPITVEPRGHVENGTTAVAVFDWRIEGAGPDGAPVALSGTAVDVLRRERGGWAQLIDMPFGGNPAATGSTSDA